LDTKSDKSPKNLKTWKTKYLKIFL